MRFLLDADLPRSCATVLRGRGHDVSDVRDIGMGSAGDDAILRHAQNERRIVVTADLDFADVRVYPPGTHAGIIVLRLPDHFKIAEINHVLQMALQELEQAEVDRALVVVSVNTIRIRRRA